MTGTSKLPRRSSWIKAIQLTVIILIANDLSAETNNRILGTDRDLDGLAAFPAKSVVNWQWTQEQKQQADQFSRMELIRDSSGKMLWTLKVSPAIPFVRPYLQILNLGIKYFPPEADAIRMKVKAISGRMIVGFGGPTAYFGDSDVFLRPVSVDATADGPEWRTVEFSFHYGLLRNFRRAGASRQAPWIYYARWAQEPTGFYIYKGSCGEIQMKDLEIVTHNISQPFPVFSAADYAPVTTLTDFQSANATGRVFTALLGENDKEFDLSWNQVKPISHPPLEIQITNDLPAGLVLLSHGRFLEEMSAVGVQLSNSKTGDGLRFRIKTETAANNLLVPAIAGQPLDFLIYASANPGIFDWARFSPLPELRRGPGHGYDYNLTDAKLKSLSNLSMAVYHARRFVPPGQWCETVIPLADFLCIDGRGDLLSCLQQQLPPNPQQLIAAVILAPWPRQGRGEATIKLQDLTLVQLKRDSGAGRSYFQFPDATQLRTIQSPKGSYSYLLAPNESELPPEVKKVFDELSE